MSFVSQRFNLHQETAALLRRMVPHFGYGVLGEVMMYKSYSHPKDDGSPEDWADIVIRVTNGTFSIRKDWYIKNGIAWDEDFWQGYAKKFAVSMFRMEWSPPGRGLWMMGHQFMYDRGSMALYNCNFTLITHAIDDDIAWLMDSLMHGCGVGFSAVRDVIRLIPASGVFEYQIPDTREGWVESVRLQIHSWLYGTPMPMFDYSLIRPAGSIIKSFGGIASGPDPLIRLHEIVNQCFDRYSKGKCDSVMLKTDLANAVGVCVVSGNVRRSAELAAGWMDDPTFIDLKDYEKFPYRAEFGWMSNNSVYLEDDTDFDRLGEIARRVIKNGEPGFINLQNLKKGRIGKNDNAREDAAIGLNPCGEIPLEHREVCNVAESNPMACATPEQWYDACGYATMYMSTVALLPTHQPTTNAVVVRNRRIGLSIMNVTGWIHTAGGHNVIRFMREGFKRVKSVNEWLAAEAGVPASIRTTTIKPGGSVPKLIGETAGCGFPTFKYTLVRFKVGKFHPIAQVLIDANVPYEQDLYEQDTWVFEIPIVQGPSKPATEASLYEQAMIVAMVQREWSDNAVSNTLYFKPKWVLTKKYEPYDLPLELSHIPERLITSDDGELVIGPVKFVGKFDEHRHLEEVHLYYYDPNHEEDDIEPVLSMIAPLTKSVSLLPHTADGVYPQMPQSGLTQAQYKERLAALRPIDWSKLKFSTPEGEGYCSGGACIRPI